MTSEPREVRCPSCGRLTPLAPFCTRCGSVIPEGASAGRARGMDRSELEAKIRQRRSADSPYLRGEPARDLSSAPAWHAPRAPTTFVPEASDELARYEAEEAAEPPRVDYLDERAASEAAADWQVMDRQAQPAQPAWQPIERPPQPAPADASPFPKQGRRDESNPWEPAGRSVSENGSADYLAAASAAGYPADVGTAYGATAEIDNARYESPLDVEAGGGGSGEDFAYSAYPSDSGYGFASGADADVAPGNDGGDAGDWDERGWNQSGDEPPRRSTAALTIVGFVVLGIAALVGGALLFSVLNVPAGLARQSATPTATEQASAAASGSAAERATPSAGESQGSSPSARPDTFNATAQPCATDEMKLDGCDVDGSTLNKGAGWVWVGFEHGQPEDVIGITVIDKASRAEEADASITLDEIGGTPTNCGKGYLKMGFDNLDPGHYVINDTRNDHHLSKAR
jgi:hypothetical protein